MTDHASKLQSIKLQNMKLQDMKMQDVKGHHCQPVKWTRFEARRLGGGRRVPEKTLSSCLAACVADISCISIDWRIGGCVLHSHSEANRTMQLDRRPLNHYRLNRNYCRGIPAIFKKINLPEFHCETHYTLILKKMDCRDASFYCTSLHYDAHPVIITSNEEQLAVVDFIIRNNGAKVDLDLQAKAQTWKSIMASGQRINPRTMSRFVWTLFPGGKMKNATYSNWLPGEPDFGQRVVGKISYTEAFVEMVYSPDKTGTLAAEWNDRYCYVKNYVLCELRLCALR